LTVCFGSAAQQFSLTLKKTTLIKSDKPYSNPYWLTEPHDLGLFTVKEKSLIGKPEMILL